MHQHETILAHIEPQDSCIVNHDVKLPQRTLSSCTSLPERRGDDVWAVARLFALIGFGLRCLRRRPLFQRRWDIVEAELDRTGKSSITDCF
jgi:hypothetical protein